MAILAVLCLSASVLAQIDPKTAILEGRGWDAIAAGRAHDAAEAFRQAITGDPKNARLHLGAGTAAFLERRDADAKDALEHALRLEPGLSRARALLGQVIYRSGDLIGAIRAYDGTIRVPMRGALNDAQELDRVLAHEFTHALIRGLAPHGVPQWLNEGLATALESSDLSWAEKRVREGGAPIALAAPQLPFALLAGGQAQLAYAASALAARRLLDEAGGVAILNLLRDLGQGSSFDAAFERRIQRSLAEFERSLR